MDDQHQQERHISLGSALERLSVAREARGAVGVVDPFEVVPAEDRLAAATPMRGTNRRRGLFTFSQRGRNALDA